MWNDSGSKNSSTIQTQTWLVRRYAFQHPQRAGDIARLLPSSFILRNPRDCKDFQRQAGWNMWKSPAFPAYEHSWYVATQRCWVEIFAPKIGGKIFSKAEKCWKHQPSRGVMIWLVMFEFFSVRAWFAAAVHGPFRNVWPHALEVDRYPRRQMYRGVIRKEKGELELNPEFGEACQAYWVQFKRYLYASSCVFFVTANPNDLTWLDLTDDEFKMSCFLMCFFSRLSYSFYKIIHTNQQKCRVWSPYWFMVLCYSTTFQWHPPQHPTLDPLGDKRDVDSKEGVEGFGPARELLQWKKSPKSLYHAWRFQRCLWFLPTLCEFKSNLTMIFFRWGAQPPTSIMLWSTDLGNL